ncbi:MAG: DUF3574 domain-containing protein [Kiritimatiellae bacterium]|nr:DUF3574 domain-containing protein [Kiritimatiellia bacterium]
MLNLIREINFTRLQTFLLLVVLLPIAACSAASRHLECPEGQRTERAELYFGLSRSDGKLISEPEWISFLSSAISPKLGKNGFTVLDTKGVWTSKTGQVINEASKVLIVIGDTETSDLKQRLKEVRDRYLDQFKQESVLLAVTPVCVSW